MQQGLGRRSDALVLQDRVQRIDHRDVTHHHQMGVVAQVAGQRLAFSKLAGIALERSTEIGLGDEIVIDSAQQRRRLGSCGGRAGGLRARISNSGGKRQKRKRNRQISYLAHGWAPFVYVASRFQSLEICKVNLATAEPSACPGLPRLLDFCSERSSHVCRRKKSPVKRGGCPSQ